MLLVEAARQAVRAAIARPGADFSFVDARFLKLVEFRYPLEVIVAPSLPGGDPGEVKVSMIHEGELLVSLVARVNDPG
jgi:hypothetical protein